jgi:hypothetical protein
VSALTKTVFLYIAIIQNAQEKQRKYQATNQMPLLLNAL